MNSTTSSRCPLLRLLHPEGDFGHEAGVVAIFSARLMNGKAPLIFEDGEQSRDFVSVHDIVNALLLSGEAEGAVGGALLSLDPLDSRAGPLAVSPLGAIFNNSLPS